MAAPKGNQNSTKDKRVWGKLIRKLAVQEDHKRLHKVAETLFKKAEEGDVACIRELGDRIDGRAEQTISGDSDQPINIIVKTGIDE